MYLGRSEETPGYAVVMLRLTFCSRAKEEYTRSIFPILIKVGNKNRKFQLMLAPENTRE